MWRRQTKDNSSAEQKPQQHLSRDVCIFWVNMQELPKPLKEYIATRPPKWFILLLHKSFGIPAQIIRNESQWCRIVHETFLRGKISNSENARALFNHIQGHFSTHKIPSRCFMFRKGKLLNSCKVNIEAISNLNYYYLCLCVCACMSGMAPTLLVPHKVLKSCFFPWRSWLGARKWWCRFSQGLFFCWWCILFFEFLFRVTFVNAMLESYFVGRDIYSKSI